MTFNRANATATRLRSQGFDNLRVVGDGPDDYAVQLGCSQCSALAVNGIATHEHGCPNQLHACRECGDVAAGRKGGLCEFCGNESR